MYKNQQKSYNFTFNYLRKEFFGTLSVVIYYRKNFYLAISIDEIIQKLQSGGFIEYWHDEYLQKERKKESGHQVQLNFHHFEGIFQIWLIGIGFAGTFFLMELLFNKLVPKRD